MTRINRKWQAVLICLPLFAITMMLSSCNLLGSKAEPDIMLEISVSPLETSQSSFTKQEMNSIKAIMEKRIESLEASSFSITIQGQSLKIGIVGYTDIENVKSLLGKPGQLSFQDDQGQIIVTGAHLKNVTYSMSETMTEGKQEPIIKLEFDEEGTRLFAIATQQNIGKQISISLDDELLMAPVVRDTINNGVVILSFGGSSSDALKAVQQTTALLKGGAIPAEITIVKAETR